MAETQGTAERDLPNPRWFINIHPCPRQLGVRTDFAHDHAPSSVEASASPPSPRRAAASRALALATSKSPHACHLATPAPRRTGRWKPKMPGASGTGSEPPPVPPPVTALVPTPRPSATGASPLAHLSPQSPHPSSSMMISDAESDSKPSYASAPLEAGAATCVPPLLTRCRCVLILVEAWELRLAAHFAISSVAFFWQAADTGLTPAAAVVARRRRSSVRVAERAPGAAGRRRCPWLCAASPGAPPMADRFTNSRHWPKKVGVCDSAASRLNLPCRASRPCSP